MNNPKINLTFDNTAKQFILDVFKANVNAEGFILTQEGTYFPSLDNKPVSFHEFAGIVKHNGMAVLVRNRIAMDFE